MTNFWQDRPTFVTGGMGFVGGGLVQRLLSFGANVVCLDRNLVPQCELVRTRLIERVKVIYGDVCDQVLMERILGDNEIDTVFHLAAQASVPIANRNPISTFETNIRGTWTLLEACRRSPSVHQIVVASSDKAYGDYDKLPYDEMTPLKGRHPYEVSKSCADLIAQAYAATFNLPVVISRCGNFYGRGDLNWNRIVPGTIRSILRGNRPVIRSDGTYVRDYFYLEDGVSAYMLLAERLAENRQLRGEAFNFSSETTITVMELVERILKFLGSDLKPEVRNETIKEIRSQHLSVEKARRVLGWKLLFSLDEGLKRTIDWYKEFLGSQIER